MRAHRLSLSRYALALRCSYWCRGDVECPEDPPGKPARVGTLVHRMSEAHVRGLAFEAKPADDLREIAEALSIFSGPLKGWLDAWKSAPFPHAVEMRLRYDADADAVREVPRRDDPKYTPPGPMEVTGELDLVQVTPGVSLDVIDLKTGQKRHVQEEQLHSYGVLAERYWKVPKVRIAFLYARKTKTDLTPWVEMDTDRLDAEAGRLRRTLRTIPTSEPNPGEWCWRCPLGKAGRCPARQPEDSYREPEAPAELTDDVRLF